VGPALAGLLALLCLMELAAWVAIRLRPRRFQLFQYHRWWTMW